ncbi:hypothetical protein BH10BAC2_BH10BAC2_35560 [soil metagenome]
MQFDLQKSIEILERTPIVLEQMLSGLHHDWTINNEGPDTWNPYDVIGHLIHGEKTDWIPRTKIILSASDDKNFVHFNRFAQLTESKDKTITELLDEFKKLRKENLDYLRSLHIDEVALNNTGIHPAFGEVSLQQLLATWAVHDLNHIAQTARVMAKQYKEAVGPWVGYLKVLK